MVWTKSDKDKSPKLPNIEQISTPIPAISKYLEAFRLPEAFKEAENDTLPVINKEGEIVGIVSEYDLAQLLPEWSFQEESYKLNITVEDIMTTSVWTETAHTNIENLLESVHEMHTRVIPIVDELNLYTGYCITRTTLISYLTKMVKPSSIGGLATPLGVYLTDGIHTAGAYGQLGFITLGITFALIYSAAMYFTALISSYIQIPMFLAVILQLGLFIAFLKLTPLVQYHAAEHQTIHAIEKGLPLAVNTIRMQPRPHKRCGTNIVILIMGIQLIILTSSLFKTPPLNFLILVFGFMFMLSYWKKMGMWVQEYLTTSPASEKQILKTIKTGQELLNKHKADTSNKSPTLLLKIINMGFFQIILSFLTTLWLFNLILFLK